MNILKMVPIGRSASYNQSNAIAIPQHKLQVWPGYVIGIDKYKGGLLLMCDVSHKVLREQTAYDIMYVTLLSLTYQCLSTPVPAYLSLHNPCLSHTPQTQKKKH